MLHLMQWLINPKEEVHGLSCTFGNTLFFCRTSSQIIMNRHDAQITTPPTPCLHVLDLSAHHHASCLHTLGESFKTYKWGGLQFQVLTNLFASLDLYIVPVSVFIIHMGIADRETVRSHLGHLCWSGMGTEAVPFSHIFSHEDATARSSILKERAVQLLHTRGRAPCSHSRQPQ